MDFTIGKHNYRTSSFLDPFVQMHIARKISPAIPLVSPLIDPKNADKDNSILTVMALSRISDEDCEYIVHNCLSKVLCQQGENFAPIMARGSLMFDDITMPQMLEITVQVIQENLGDFFRTALSGLDRQVQST